MPLRNIFLSIPHTLKLIILGELKLLVNISLLILLLNEVCGTKITMRVIVPFEINAK